MTWAALSGLIPSSVEPGEAGSVKAQSQKETKANPSHNQYSFFLFGLGLNPEVLHYQAISPVLFVFYSETESH